MIRYFYTAKVVLEITLRFIIALAHSKNQELDLELLIGENYQTFKSVKSLMTLHIGI